jgi:hypothetical protein
VQTCSKCFAQNPDNVQICSNCQTDLKEWSVTAIALKKLQANPRVSAIRIAVANACCPVCQQAQGVYPKDQVPALPIEGCSGASGCNCFYEPLLEEIYP